MVTVTVEKSRLLSLGRGSEREKKRKKYSYIFIYIIYYIYYIYNFFIHLFFRSAASAYFFTVTVTNCHRKVPHTPPTAPSRGYPWQIARPCAPKGRQRLCGRKGKHPAPRTLAAKNQENAPCKLSLSGDESHAFSMTNDRLFLKFDIPITR